MADAQTFFGEILPGGINAGFEAFEKKVANAEAEGAANASQLRAALDGIKAVEATLLFEITGDGGKSFFFNQKAGRVVVGDAAASPPVVTVSQSLSDFDALQAAGATPVVGGGGGRGGRGARIFNRNFIDQVGALNKVLKIVINEMPGEATTWVRLGKDASKPEPDTTMTLSLMTYEDMTAGKIPPPAAFMQGLLRVDGDIALLMQLAQLAMSQ